MKNDERPRSSADAGRVPSWERKNNINPYFLVLIIALLASVACLYFWGKDRAEAKLRLNGQFRVHAEAELPRLAENFTSTFGLYSGKCQLFIEDIELAVLNSVSRYDLFSLPTALFADMHMRGAWILLERNEEHDLPPFAINSGRHDSKTGESYAKSVMQSEYYVAARKRNALKISPIMRSEIDMNSLFSSFDTHNSAVKESITLLVDGPVTSGGRFAGIAGFEVELPAIGETLFTTAYLSGLDLFLIDPNGEIAMSSRGVFAGENYRNVQQKGYPAALMACVAGVANGERLDTFLAERDSSPTFAAFVPVDVGDGGPPWCLAALNDMQSVSNAGRARLFALFLIWSMALVVILIIREVRKRRASMAATKQAVAAMQPEAAAFFKKYEWHRKACYVLSGFLCLPAMFALQIYEKRYLAALHASDIEAAAKALKGMKRLTAAGVVLGCIVVYVNFMCD